MGQLSIYPVGAKCNVGLRPDLHVYAQVWLSQSNHTHCRYCALSSLIVPIKLYPCTYRAITVTCIHNVKLIVAIMWPHPHSSATTTIQTHPLTWSAVTPHTNFRLWTTQVLSAIVVHTYVKYVYIHVCWTCATMVAVVTLTGWVLPLPNQICYDDNDQDDNSRTNESTYYSSCDSSCCYTTNTRRTCCWWSCCLRWWWLSWCLRW